MALPLPVDHRYMLNKNSRPDILTHGYLTAALVIYTVKGYKLHAGMALSFIKESTKGD